jgi:hypothetical protein
MSGSFVHQFICGEAIAKISTENLRQLVNNYKQFVYLGSESPDLPYLSFSGETDWADVMHYEKTNSMAINGFEILRSRWSPAPPDTNKVKLAWLLGYVSHMIVDVTIHPIINAIVGPYVLHQDDHRRCEMTQDSLLFYEISGGELSYSNWLEHMMSCRANPFLLDDLMEFWKDNLLGAYPERAENADPGSWFRRYTEAIRVSEGDFGIKPMFRHIGRLNKYFYQTVDEIMEKNPEYASKYYYEVKLPDGSIGPFKQFGFDKAVSNVVNAWEQLYNNLSSFGLDFFMVIKNWDLDTGIDKDNAPLYFWT